MTQARAGEWKVCLRAGSPAIDWIPSVLAGNTGETVKRNALRSVYRYRTGERVHYVKHDKPCGFLGRLKSLFRSKSEAEYDSFCLLRDAGVPVVDMIGWGRCRKEGILISREEPGAENAKAWWFSGQLRTVQERHAFLCGLSIFLERVFDSGLFHPDFHIGNLLYRPTDSAFVIVDPYGVKRIQMKTRHRFRMLRLIGALRGELADTEANAWIRRFMPERYGLNPETVWNEILHAEADEMNRLWPKRRAQILSGGSRHARSVRLRDGSAAFVRVAQSGLLCFPDPSEDPESRFIARHGSRSESERLWLESFLLDFHRIPHPMPVVWKRGERKNGDTLYVDPASTASPLTDEEIRNRMRIAGIPCSQRPDPALPVIPENQRRSS